MKDRNFSAAFSILFEAAKESMFVSSREAFYRLLFQNVYQLVDDDMYSNDTLRRVTSGTQPIPGKILKALHSEVGFEQLRKSIEKNCQRILQNAQVMTEISELLDDNTDVPSEIKKQILSLLYADTDFGKSQGTASVLVYLNYSDIMQQRNKASFTDPSFMRLSQNVPLPQYPKYITECPECGVKKLYGREDALKMLHDDIIEGKQPLMISAVGGIGKTELVKRFLDSLKKTDITECGIEKIAWIPYINHDLLQSCKQALNLSCEHDAVWMEMQEIAEDYGEKLLLVIDNIEEHDDIYLRKISTLPCRILATSRSRDLPGFKVFPLDTLSMEDSRKLFYEHYRFPEKDNETVTDIIELASRHTITIVFLAKAAYSEGMSLHTLYQKLVEKGFKLSEEDVSCEHEKLHNDNTIIKQMCILFSILGYKESDKSLLTYISVIPNLQFEFEKAKRWFNVKKNSILQRLNHIGMLEHSIDNRTHIYWMHSVIAAAIREQQKEVLYETAHPFVDILSEELDFDDQWGKGYKKSYLIPFSWSVADIMENHWNSEDDASFLIRLFYVCFECSNYALSKTLLERAMEIDLKTNDYAVLVRDYKCLCDVMLKFEDIDAAIEALEKAEGYLRENSDNALEWTLLWNKFGTAYLLAGEYEDARAYFDKALETDKKIEGVSVREISSDYSSIACLLRDAGECHEAYSYIKTAIELDDRTEDDSELYMNYYYLAGICTDLVNEGYEEYFDEAVDSFERVISFREKHLGRTNTDLADIYHEYSLFLYYTDDFESALHYNQLSYDINLAIYSEYSLHVLQNLNTRAIILSATSEGLNDAIEIHRHIFETLEQMNPISAADLACFHYNYADELQKAKDYDTACKHFLKSIECWTYAFSESSIKLMDSYYGLADCYYVTEQFEDAIEYYRKAIDVASSRPDRIVEISLNLAECYMMIYRSEDAVRTLTKAITLYRSEGFNIPAFEVELHLLLRSAYTLNNQPEKADEAYEYAKQAAKVSEDVELIQRVHDFLIIEK